MKFSYLAIIVVLIAISAGITICSDYNEQETNMLLMDPPAFQLTNHIEKICGQKVSWKVATDPSHHDNMAGAMFEGCNPVVLLNIPPQDIPSDVIFHELLHLYLMASNKIYISAYASPLYDHLISQISHEDKLLEVFLHAHSILHHTYIFPKMVEAGYHVSDSFKRFDDIDKYPFYEEVVSDFHVAIDAWHMKAGQVDDSLKMGNYLNNIRDQFPRQFETGLRLYASAKSFDSPEKEPEVFSEIIRELFSYDGEIHYAKGNRGSACNIMAYY